jgi:hypothetical protein
MKEISYNFGAIRDSIMKLSASELIKESQSKTMNTFLESVQKSSLLKKQHLIFKNLQESKSFDKERLAERFLNQNLQLFSNEKWSDILEENKKLRRGLLDDMHVEARKDEALFEAISTLIENITNPNFSDFEKEQNSYEFVIKHLTRPVLSESDKSTEKSDFPTFAGNSWKYLTKMAISNFNERFNHLNENEKKAFKILVSDYNTKSKYLESLRKENIEIIDNKIQEEKDTKTVEMLSGFRNKLEALQNVTPQKIDEGIVACLELNEALK